MPRKPTRSELFKTVAEIRHRRGTPVITRAAQPMIGDRLFWDSRSNAVTHQQTELPLWWDPKTNRLTDQQTGIPAIYGNPRVNYGNPSILTPPPTPSIQTAPIWSRGLVPGHVIPATPTTQSVLTGQVTPPVQATPQWSRGIVPDDVDPADRKFYTGMPLPSAPSGFQRQPSVAEQATSIDQISEIDRYETLGHLPPLGGGNLLWAAVEAIREAMPDWLPDTPSWLAKFFVRDEAQREFLMGEMPETRVIQAPINGEVARIPITYNSGNLVDLLRYVGITELPFRATAIAEVPAVGLFTAGLRAFLKHAGFIFSAPILFFQGKPLNESWAKANLATDQLVDAAKRITSPEYQNEDYRTMGISPEIIQRLDALAQPEYGGIVTPWGDLEKAKQREELLKQLSDEALDSLPGIEQKWLDVMGDVEDARHDPDRERFNVLYQAAFDIARNEYIPAFKLSRTAAFGMDMTRSWTWVMFPEKEKEFLDALAHYMVQFGRTPGYMETVQIREHFEDAAMELSGGAVFDTLNIFPLTNLPGFVLQPVGRGAMKIITWPFQQLIAGAKKLPVIGGPVRWFFSRALESAANDFRFRAFRVGDAIAANSRKAIGAADETATDFVWSGYAKAADELLVASRNPDPKVLAETFDQLIASGDLPRVGGARMADDLVQMANTIPPAKWSGIVQSSHDELVQNVYIDYIVRGRIERLIDEAAEAGEVINRATAKERLFVQAAQYVQSNPRRIASLIGDHFHATYIDAHRVQGSQLLDSSLMRVFFTKKNEAGALVFRGRDSRYLAQATSIVSRKLGNLWVKSVLAARPAWVIWNYIDSLMRASLYGRIPFTDALDVARGYTKVPDDAILPPELLQFIFGSQQVQFGKGGSLVDLMLRGEWKPRLGLLSYLWEGISRRYTAARLGGVAGLVEEGKGVLGAGWDALHGLTDHVFDYNSAIEFGLRYRLFDQHYTRAIKMMSDEAFDIVMETVGAGPVKGIVGEWKEAWAAFRRAGLGVGGPGQLDDWLSRIKEARPPNGISRVDWAIANADADMNQVLDQLAAEKAISKPALMQQILTEVDAAPVIRAETKNLMAWLWRRFEGDPVGLERYMKRLLGRKPGSEPIWWKTVPGGDDFLKTLNRFNPSEQKHLTREIAFLIEKRLDDMVRAGKPVTQDVMREFWNETRDMIKEDMILRNADDSGIRSMAEVYDDAAAPMPKADDPSIRGLTGEEEPPPSVIAGPEIPPAAQVKPGIPSPRPVARVSDDILRRWAAEFNISADELYTPQGVYQGGPPSYHVAGEAQRASMGKLQQRVVALRGQVLSGRMEVRKLRELAQAETAESIGEQADKLAVQADGIAMWAQDVDSMRYALKQWLLHAWPGPLRYPRGHPARGRAFEMFFHLGEQYVYRRLETWIDEVFQAIESGEDIPKLTPHDFLARLGFEMSYTKAGAIEGIKVSLPGLPSIRLYGTGEKAIGIFPVEHIQKWFGRSGEAGMKASWGLDVQSIFDPVNATSGVVKQARVILDSAVEAAGEVAAPMNPELRLALSVYESAVRKYQALKKAAQAARTAPIDAIDQELVAAVKNFQAAHEARIAARKIPGADLYSLGAEETRLKNILKRVANSNNVSFDEAIRIVTEPSSRPVAVLDYEQSYKDMIFTREALDVAAKNNGMESWKDVLKARQAQIAAEQAEEASAKQFLDDLRDWFKTQIQNGRTADEIAADLTTPEEAGVSLEIASFMKRLSIANEKNMQQMVLAMFADPEIRPQLFEEIFSVAGIGESQTGQMFQQAWDLWMREVRLEMGTAYGDAAKNYDVLTAYIKQLMNLMEMDGNTANEIYHTLNRHLEESYDFAHRLMRALGEPLPTRAAVPQTHLLREGVRGFFEMMDETAAKYGALLDMLRQWEAHIDDLIDKKGLFAARLPSDDIAALRKFYKEAPKGMHDMMDLASYGTKNADVVSRMGGVGQGLIKKLPINEEGAVNFVNRIMINYVEYSNADAVAKKFVPFWMFGSRNLPFWMETMFVHPEIAAFYQKYLRFSRQVSYDQGAVNSNGEQLPRLVGFVPIPGTEIWINLAAPFSFRLLFPRGRRYNTEKEEGLSGIWSWLHEHAISFGFSPNPLFAILGYETGMLDPNRFPAWGVFPQTDLIPPYMQDWLRTVTRRIPIVGHVTGRYLLPEVSWIDYLIERDLLIWGLQEIEANPNRKEVIAAQVMQALKDREQNKLWMDTRASVKKTQHYDDIAAYFTGFYAKHFTDGEAELLALRNELNQYRDYFNLQLGGQFFDLDPDIFQAYDLYKDQRYNTPEGQFYNLYNNIRFTSTPEPEGRQLYGQDRRDLILRRIEEDEATTAYYDAIQEAILNRDAKLDEFPVGAPGELRAKIWQDYFALRLAIEEDEMYEIARRGFVVGYQPYEVLEKRFTNQWWWMLRETQPQWNRDRGESYEQWQAEMGQWLIDLPTIGQVLAGSFMAEEFSEHAEALKKKDFDVKEFVTQMLEVTDAEGYEAWDKANDTVYDALMKAWTALHLDPYFASQVDEQKNRLTGRELLLAQERFKRNHQTPTAEQLTAWVMENYEGQFDQADLMKRAGAQGILSVEQRFAPDPEDEVAVLKDEFWQILHSIPPGQYYSDFIKEFERAGGDKSFIDAWYDTNGNIVEALKDPDKFKLMIEAALAATDSLELRPLTVAELEEQVAATKLNDEFKAKVERTFGVGFYEMRSEYYSMSFTERADWRKANPDLYALIKAYSPFRDQFALDNPVWAKYYHREALEPGFRSGAGGGVGGRGGRGGRGPRLAAAPSDTLQFGERSTWDAAWLLDPRNVGRAGVTKGVKWPRRLLERGGPVLEKELNALANDKKPLSDPAIKFLKNLQESDSSMSEIVSAVLAMAGVMVSGPGAVALGAAQSVRGVRAGGRRPRSSGGGGPSRME